MAEGQEADGEIKNSLPQCGNAFSMSLAYKSNTIIHYILTL